MTGTLRLGLDLGRSMGWALSEGNVIVASGVEILSNSDMPIGFRGHMMYNWLLDFTDVDEVYYEKVINHGKMNVTRTAHDYGGYEMIMNLVFYGVRKPVIPIITTTLKKEFTGDGRAQKEDMCRVAHFHGWKGGRPGTAQSNDEADAIALLAVAAARMGQKISFSEE